MSQNIVYAPGGLASVGPKVISGHGAPPVSFRGQLGQIFIDSDTSPPTPYIFNGQTWTAL